MAIEFLRYPLNGNFVHNWLISPVVEDDDRLPELPVSDGDPVFAQQKTILWRYFRCREDHYLTPSADGGLPQGKCYFAYAAFRRLSRATLQLTIGALGAGIAVLDGKNLKPLQGKVQNGATEYALAVGKTPAGMLIKITPDADGHNEPLVYCQVGSGADVEVALPARIEREHLELRRQVEEAAYAGFLDRYVIGNLEGDRYNKNEAVQVTYRNEQGVAHLITHRAQSLQGDIFQEKTRKAEKNTNFLVAQDFPLRSGPHHLAFLPTAKEYYEHRLQFERRDLFHVVRSKYSSKPIGNQEDRAADLLKFASEKPSGDPFSDLARLKRGNPDKLSPRHLLEAVRRVRQGEGAWERDFLAILHMLLRFRKEIPVALRNELLGLLDEPELWVRLAKPVTQGSLPETRTFLRIVDKALAGRALGRKKAPDGLTGTRHAQAGQKAAQEWMQERLQWGLQTWNTPSALEAALAGAVSLLDLSRDEGLAELAVVFIDKTLFDLAQHSWKGQFGGARAYAENESALSSRLEATSGISRLLWGLGNWNEALMGAVCLALSDRYELPEVIREITREVKDAVWSRQRSRTAAGEMGEWATYRTRDFQLGCLQNGEPGRSNQRTHTWQACLGPDAIVYTNHPASMQVENSERPGFWTGNGSNPRAMQWGDVLACMYQLPADDWLGFTHAYFPTVKMDEYCLSGNWAFARVGKAYLGLYSSNPMHLVETGETALRELRAHGREQVWICQMGHELLDESFAAFQERVKALPITIETRGNETTISWETLRGENLQLGWSSLFLVNGAPMPEEEPFQYASPYCQAGLPSVGMTIHGSESGIQLDFA